MAGEVATSGALKIGNEADRVTVASILYKNGYSVSPLRLRKNGKSYEYYVQYQMDGPEPTGGAK